MSNFNAGNHNFSTSPPSRRPGCVNDSSHSFSTSPPPSVRTGSVNDSNYSFRTPPTIPVRVMGGWDSPRPAPPVYVELAQPYQAPVVGAGLYGTQGEPHYDRRRTADSVLAAVLIGTLSAGLIYLICRNWWRP